MRSTIIFLLAILSNCLSAQNVVDGIYVKENYVKYPICNLYNEKLIGLYGNDMLSLRQSTDDSAYLKIDTVRWQSMNRPTPPLKINDCVYFNPAVEYICNYNGKSLLPKNFYLNTVDYNQVAKQKWGKYIDPNFTMLIPNSLRFYIDTSEIEVTPGSSVMLTDSFFHVPEENYLRPFYFRKFEVTNAEYREFVLWVRDSIAHKLIGDNHVDSEGEPGERINWKIPIEWDNPKFKETLEELYLPEHARWYYRNEIDVRKLLYSYHPDSNSLLYINIYPDTLKWVRDFNYSYNEAYTNMYFWHPAFNNYPVVCINYKQAIAYLNWKTEKHQKELDKKGINFKVEYDLPNEIEWDMAATAENTNKQPRIFTPDYYKRADNTWITNLSIKQYDKDIYKDTVNHAGMKCYINRPDFLFESLTSTVQVSDKEQESTSPANLLEIKQRNAFQNANLDVNGISFMGGNVSEWLKETYKENWKPVFTKRQQMLNSFNDYDAKILAQTEAYFDKKNNTEGKLVRGGNWYDERVSQKFGKNTEGMNAKLFVHPDSAYSTIGFRYVIHVYPK